MHCPGCTNAMEPVGSASYYTKQKRFSTPIEFCSSCDIYGRDAAAEELVDHYYAASYVQPENEARFREQREGFFSYLLGLLPESKNQRILDFGSSYGHLLEQAKANGHEVCGVELNQDLVTECNARGLPTVQKLEEAPGLFDAITLIDSLYCVPDPVATLNLCRSKLASDGLLLMRITNRNGYARIMNRLKHRTDFSTLGDATFSYSTAGVTRVLTRAGFDVVSVSPDYGLGKTGLGRKTLAYYALCRNVGKLSRGRIDLAPGLIVSANSSEMLS
jgi:SAM-dependent methyltransferase